MDMVSLHTSRQVDKPKVVTTCTTNSYDHRVELYIFNGVLRGLCFKPMRFGTAWWFGDDVTLNEIIEEDLFMGYFIGGFLKLYPEIKLPK